MLRWQTVLAAALTMAGLAIAGVYGGEQVRSQIEANAAAARKQHNREQITEALRVAATLAGELAATVRFINLELGVLDDMYANAAQRREPATLSATLRSARDSIRQLRFFESTGENIGLLGAPVVEQIARFHALLEYVRATYLDEKVEEAKTFTPEMVSMNLDNYQRAAMNLKTEGETAYDAIKARIAELEAERDAL